MRGNKTYTLTVRRSPEAWSTRPKNKQSQKQINELTHSQFADLPEAWATQPDQGGESVQCAAYPEESPPWFNLIYQFICSRQLINSIRFINSYYSNKKWSHHLNSICPFIFSAVSLAFHFTFILRPKVTHRSVKFVSPHVATHWALQLKSNFELEYDASCIWRLGWRMGSLARMRCKYWCAEKACLDRSSQGVFGAYAGV